VAVALRETLTPHETEMVDLMNKPDNFTALYEAACADEKARAKVPILEVGDNGPILVESLVICEYLYDSIAGNNAGEKALTAVQKASARLFTTLCAPKLSFIKILTSEPGSEEESKAVQDLRAGLRDINAYLERHGDPTGPFFFGDSFSVLAEAVLAPFVQRLVAVLPGLRPEFDPLAMMEEDGLTRLATWTKAICERESCIDTIAPKSELVSGYSKMLERMKQATAPSAN
jgi:glutathione S-transferase